MSTSRLTFLRVFSFRAVVLIPKCPLPCHFFPAKMKRRIIMRNSSGKGTFPSKGLLKRRVLSPLMDWKTDGQRSRVRSTVRLSRELEWSDLTSVQSVWSSPAIKAHFVLSQLRCVQSPVEELSNTQVKAVWLNPPLRILSRDTSCHKGSPISHKSLNLLHNAWSLCWGLRVFLILINILTEN